MLRLDAPKRTRFCDGLTRRDFLHAGALPLLGLTLADPHATNSLAASWQFFSKVSQLTDPILL